MAKRRTSTTDELYEENVKMSERQVTHSALTRFNNRTNRPTVNQYNKPSFTADFDNTYAWLISNTSIKQSAPSGHFKCWTPYEDTKGIQLQNSGYYRISYRGAYYMAHVFTWIYHHPGQAVHN